MTELTGENVSMHASGVNGSGGGISIQEVIEWVDAQVAKRDMTADAGKVRITALLQMQEQVAADEPGDAKWVADNIARLRERWARGNPEGKANTAKTYASRAAATIREYFLWASAPDKYVPPSNRTKEKSLGDKSSTPKKTRAKAKTAAPEPPADPAPQSAPQGKVRTFPVANGEIAFQLPPDGVDFNDVKKFAVHLLTLTSDFDISSPEQAQVFAMVVRGNRD